MSNRAAVVILIIGALIALMAMLVVFRTEGQPVNPSPSPSVTVL